MAKQLKLFFKRKSYFEPKVHHQSNSTTITLFDDEEPYIKRTNSAEDFSFVPHPLVDISTLKSKSTSSLSETNFPNQGMQSKGFYLLNFLFVIKKLYFSDNKMNQLTKVSLLDIDNWIWMEMKNSEKAVHKL